ncbi:MAG: winged helix DNA-binding protein [Candidatus Omnitrophica bacterium]|nr:winged helix DNA-binding protein [Candidatus Omnitrophota bacterium]
MTGIIQRLVEAGYVMRIPGAKDRRIIRIKLTPKALNLVKRINLRRQKMISRIFSKLSSDKRQQYLEILERIRDILARG